PNPSRPRLDQLLSPLPRARGLRRIQAIGYRTREPLDDARPLPANQEPARELRSETDGVLLIDKVTCTPEAAELIRALRAEHGPLMFHQSGGCCDGSAPMCYPL